MAIVEVQRVPNSYQVEELDFGQSNPARVSFASERNESRCSEQEFVIDPQSDCAASSEWCYSLWPAGCRSHLNFGH